MLTGNFRGKQDVCVALFLRSAEVQEEKQYAVAVKYSPEFKVSLQCAKTCLILVDNRSKKILEI